MDILEKIDKLRLEKGWSKNYLAMEAGLTQSTLNNLYTRHTEPKLSTLRALCNALGVGLSDFFKEDCTIEDELLTKIKALSHNKQKALLLLLSEQD